MCPCTFADINFVTGTLYDTNRFEFSILESFAMHNFMDILRLCSTSGYSASALAVDETLCRPGSWLPAHKMAGLFSRHIRVKLPLTGLQERYMFCDHVF